MGKLLRIESIQNNTDTVDPPPSPTNANLNKDI